jgi:hypothetical protein
MGRRSPCGASSWAEENDVIELLVPVSAFLCMIGGVFIGFFSQARTSSLQTQAKTQKIVSLLSNIFVVTSSLVLGLMLNEAKSTLELNNNNLHALASQIILLDRTMRALGPEANEARGHLLDYVQISLKENNILEEDPEAEISLDAAGSSLRALHFSDDRKIALWSDARQLYRQVLQQRWVVVDASSGTMPTPMIVTLILWLSAIFAGFGYRAPDNAIVRASFLIAALLISSGLFVILDMGTPASGLLQTSNFPFQRALAHLQR